MSVVRSIGLVFVVALSTSLLESAELPKSMSFKLNDIEVELTNFAVVTGEASDMGGLPEKPMPVSPKKLMPPSSSVWITFDYKTNFEKSETPEGSQFLAVGIEIPQGKNWGYGPADINMKLGKGSIRLTVFGSNKVTTIDDEIQLVVYTRQNNGQNRQQTSETGIPVKYSVDGQVMLSTTEYNELQAMKKKLADLEKRLATLEKKK